MSPRPDSSQNGGVKKKGQESRLLKRINKLIEQFEESRKREERQRQEHKEEIEKLL